jgi:hypothetical protein
VTFVVGVVWLTKGFEIHYIILLPPKTASSLSGIGRFLHVSSPAAARAALSQ